MVKSAQYAVFLWDDKDYDWSFALSLFQFKLKRIRKHILKHDIIVDADKIGAEMQEVIDLIDKLSDENWGDKDYEEKWNLMWGKVNKNIRGWWD
jgi:hypothetical protein